MKRQRDKDKPKGQRPITSFLFKTANSASTSAPASGSAKTSDQSYTPLVGERSAPSPCHVESLPPLEEPAKRPRTGSGGTISAHEEPTVSQQGQQAPGPVAASKPSRSTAATAAVPPSGGMAASGAGAIPLRDASRHARLQHKLVSWAPRGGGGSSGPSGAAAGAGGGGGMPGPSAKLTPLEQQVVELKGRHPGVLLILEVGYKAKFFGEDAINASRVLGIGHFPDHNFLVGSVPVPRLPVHVRRLVDAGYRVGVVRQVETAAIKAAGANKSAPFERKLTGIYTKATLEAGELAGLAEPDASQSGSLWSSKCLSNRLVCVVEGPQQQQQQRRRRTPGGPQGELGSGGGGGGEAAGGMGDGKGGVAIGLVAVEPSTGEVLYDEFRDSLMRAELESKLLFLAPAEILAAGPLSSPTRRLLGSLTAASAPAGAQTQAPSRRGRTGGGASAVHASAGGGAARLEIVDGGRYLEGGALAAAIKFYGEGSQPSSRGGGGDGGGDSEGSQAGAEPGAEGAAGAVDSVLRLPPLVLRALAHALDYLKPLGVERVLRLGAAFRELSTAQEMALGPNTLRQLEILTSVDGVGSGSSGGGERGSLLWLMDQTLTRAGGRLMRRWVAQPLRDRGAIEERLDAVEELLREGTDQPVLSKVPGVLSKVLSKVDLERSVTRAFHGTAAPSEFLHMLHTLGTLHSTLGLVPSLGSGGFPAGDVAAGRGSRESEGSEVDREGEGGCPAVEAPGVESVLLRRLLAAAGDLRVAAAAREMLEMLEEEAAERNDMLGLFREADPPPFPAVSHWRQEVATTEEKLQGLLPELAQRLNVRSVSYVSLQNQGDYLVEVPSELVSRVPRDWEKVSSTKKALRYHPPEVKAALQQLALAKEHMQAACAAAWKQLLSRFGEKYMLFRGAVQALAALDCLNSLAVLATNAGYTRPTLLDAGPSTPPQLDIVAGRHPVLDMVLQGSFVPNDTHLRGDAQSTLVVTGPNMGGKSVFIKQSALIAIMAQVGSFVPAESCTMHVMDGVFTRMGASDSIALGRSTFMEELGEASAILEKATPRSLVIMDELGRGTSTRDGVAIAAATLQYIATEVGCLTLFVSHFPQVAALHKQFPDQINTAYMSYQEEEGVEEAGAGWKGGEGQEDPALPHITFLYKVAPGVAPRSFGLNVARMAHLPLSVVQRAAVLAGEIEAADRARKGGAQQQGQHKQQQQQQEEEGRGGAQPMECKAAGPEGPGAVGGERLQGAAGSMLRQIQGLLSSGQQLGAAELRGVQVACRAALGQ